MASIVVMRLPAAAEIGVMHERTGLPSRWIVHAPHKREAATEFRASHAEHVAQHPEQRRVVVDIGAVRGSVDFYGEGHSCLKRCWGMGAIDRVAMAINIGHSISRG